jgi:tyrosine-protein phosphatase YwqE
VFFFSKNKAVLKDLIPDHHVDIHSHLLPGIDDGARTFADSLRLTQSLQSLGITQIITTPHIIQHVWDNNQEDIDSLCKITKTNLSNKNINIPFQAAAEYLMDDQFVQLFQSQNLLTLKDNYVLVEMSYINAPIQLYTILFDLQLAGYIPVLAHPERYLFYQNNFEEYKRLKRAGCLFQLNLLAVVGYYGCQISKTAEKLLAASLYDYVGSDVHHDNHIKAFSQKIIIRDIVPLQEIIKNNQFFKQ